MKRLLAVLLALLLTGSGFAMEGTDEQKKLISLDFPDASLSTVLNILSIKTGHKFLTDSELAKKRIVLSLKDVSAEEALSALLDTYNLYYVRQGETDIYVIKSKNETVITTVSRVFFLNYASAKDLEPVLTKNLTKAGSMSCDVRTNSLIVIDVADNIEKVEGMIKTLDIPTMQVLLEAKIIDLRIDRSMKWGVNVKNLYEQRYYRSPLDLTNGAVTLAKPQINYGQDFGHGTVGAGSLSFSLLSNGTAVEAVLDAVKQDSDAKLLTNPKLIVINNQEASIDIVEQIPYFESTINSGSTTITTLFKDVGIKLKVKPQINRDGSIILQVAPEQSYRTGESISNVPVINTSKTTTTFMLENGETAVIGGLIRETDNKTEYKIPLLGDIPIIGFLFKKYDKEKVRTELTIFITAKVVQ